MDGNVSLADFSDTLITSFKERDPKRHNVRAKRPHEGRDARHGDGNTRKRDRRSEVRSLNAGMHPRNVFKGNPPNFEELARQDADLRKVLRANGSVDFDHPLANFYLARALLKQNFDLTLQLPTNRLCPGIPGRLNYIHWIEDLLEVSRHASRGSKSAAGAAVSTEEVLGFDIGTGASCIYPLLGCRLHSNWKFIATDIDDESLEWAMDNVDNNMLSDRIDLRQASRHTWLVDYIHRSEQGDKQSADKFLDFCMCNPPFFASLEEAQQNRRAGCAGALHEFIYSRSDVSPAVADSIRAVAGRANVDLDSDSSDIGGEVLFIMGIICDSLLLQGRVTWYTSLVGKKSSLKVLCSLPPRRMRSSCRPPSAVRRAPCIRRSW